MSRRHLLKSSAWRGGLGRLARPAALQSRAIFIPAEPRGTTLESIPAKYNRAHHTFAVFTACATLVVITAGALVTSNDAGLSVPDWPTSFGYLVKVPHFVGGVRYEWSHRMVAGTLVSLTLAIAVWTLLVERRRWLRWLAIGALCTVITQATLGGLTVLFFQPPWLSTAHATVAQTFFCIAVAIAIFTGRRWVEEQPRTEFDSRRPSLFTLTLLSILVLYLQLILGGMFRHHGMSWWPHVLNAVTVSFVLAWTAVRALSVVFEDRGGTAPRDRDAVALDHAALSRFHRILDARGMGQRRRATGTAHGRINRRACGRGSAAAGDYGGSGDSSMAACPCRICCVRTPGATGRFGRVTFARQFRYLPLLFIRMMLERVSS